MTGSAAAKPGDQTGKGQFLWPHELRIFMAVAIISQMTIAQQEEVRHGGALPKIQCDATAKEFYKVLRTAVREWLAEKVGTPDSDMPSADAIRKAAQRWAIRLLTHGHVDDEPPHQEGYKMTGARLDILRQIRALLIKGFKTATGLFPFRSVKHAIAMSRAVAELVTRLNVKRCETVWNMLRKHFPDMYKGKWLSKKKRANEDTQVSATATESSCSCIDADAWPWKQG